MRNLNKPNRYNVASIQAQQTLGGDVMQYDENGKWVEFLDYTWLLDEYQRVTREQKLKAIPVEAQLIDRIVELKAEVERLRKAGDKLVFALEAMDIIMDTDSEHPEVAEWNAIKEGKQS